MQRTLVSPSEIIFGLFFTFFSPEELFNWLFRVVDATDGSAEDSDVKDGVKDELEADEDLDVSSLPHPDINEAGMPVFFFDL